MDVLFPTDSTCYAPVIHVKSSNSLNGLQGTMKGMLLSMTFRKLSIHLHGALRGSGEASSCYALFSIPLDKEFEWLASDLQIKEGTGPSLSTHVCKPHLCEWVLCGVAGVNIHVMSILVFLWKSFLFRNGHEIRRFLQTAGRLSLGSW